MSAIVIMSADVARRTIDAISQHLTSARALLLDLHQRDGWMALGYSSMRECLLTEFSEESYSYLTRQLNAGIVEDVLPIGNIGVTPESHLRPLTPYKNEPEVVQEIWREAVETAPEGKITAAHVERTVQQYKAAASPAISVTVEPKPIITAPTPKPPEPVKRARIANDYYPTPEAFTQALLNRVEFDGIILEPCAGHGAIADFFPDCLTNEPYPTGDFTPDYELDATNPAAWEAIGKFDWAITNPPYEPSLLIPIWQNAFTYAQKGVALLLRLNYLEPCQDRREWLHQYRNHLAHLIMFSPRPKFRADANSSDNITVAWCVWTKKPVSGCKPDFVWDWR